VSQALPEQLDAALTEALELLTRKLRCTSQTAKSHHVLVVEGWQDAPEVISAVATYLVGLLASAISRTLAVRASLDNTTRDRLELLRNVEAIAGTPSTPLTITQKQDERNPWIAEGIWHLCLFLSSRRADLHPLGPVIALDLPHVGAKDHGFDVVGLYRSAQGVGLTLVECKAYENDPNGAINAALSFYKEFDQGDHDTRARQAVASMREVLPQPDQSTISASLWKDERLYVPNPHYDASKPMEWTNTRSSFKQLAVGPDRIVIMPHAVQQFVGFFDSIAEAMRQLANKLNNV
jgi:hypothetical protein